MKPLAERLLLVAMTGAVPADDPHVIADAQAEIDRLHLQKRPVAWRVKDYADQWIILQNERDFNRS